MAWTLAVPSTIRSMFDVAVDEAQPSVHNCSLAEVEVAVARAKSTIKVLVRSITRPFVSAHAGAGGVDDDCIHVEVFGDLAMDTIPELN